MAFSKESNPNSFLSGEGKPHDVDVMYLYARSIRSIELLNAEQEIELAKTIEAGTLAEKVLEHLKSETCSGQELFQTLSSLPFPNPHEHFRKARDEWCERLAGQLQDSFSQAYLTGLVEQGKQAENLFVEANTRLVVPQARTFLYRHLPLADLVQDGNVGLQIAVRKFDWRRNFRFSTYAIPWIRQAINRGSDQVADPVRYPAPVAPKIRMLRFLIQEFQTKNGRVPSNEELFLALLENKLGHPGSPEEKSESLINLSEITDLRAHIISVVPLNFPKIYSNGEESDEEENFGLGPDTTQEAEDNIRLSFMKDCFNSLLRELPKKYETTIRMRFGLEPYLKEHTLTEIAAELEISHEKAASAFHRAMRSLKKLANKGKLKEQIQDYIED